MSSVPPAAVLRRRRGLYRRPGGGGDRPRGRRAWAASRLVESFLYGISARDPVSFVAVPVILVAVAALASLIPAWRASRVDPMAALREE